MMSEDLEKPVEAKLTYLDEWFERLRQATEAVPLVQANREMTQWALDALSNRPEGSDDISPGNLAMELQKDYEFTKEKLPLMPLYHVQDAFSSIVASTSANTAIYGFILQHSSLGTPEAQVFVQQYTEQYHKLEAIRDRPKRIRELLANLGIEGLMQRFDRALHAHSQAMASVGQRTAAALEMRTLLDGLKGELFEKARRKQKENMIWEQMARRLAVGGPNSHECRDLINQEGYYDSLYGELSEIGKDREGPNQINLQNVWTRLENHLFTVLGLVSVARKTNP